MNSSIIDSALLAYIPTDLETYGIEQERETLRLYFVVVDHENTLYETGYSDGLVAGTHG